MAPFFGYAGKLPMPDQLLLISPWVDAESQVGSQRLAELESKDWWLSSKVLRGAASMYAGNGKTYAAAVARVPKAAAALLPKPADRTHPYLSPLRDPEHFRLLAEHGIRVTLTYSERDTLCIDAEDYIAKLDKAGVQTRALLGRNGSHVCPSFAFLGLTESRAAFDWMFDAVKAQSRAS